MASPTSINTYILFLRGINVGGNKKVPMADLKKLLVSLGFQNVKTYLASGNASFEAEKKPTAAEIERQIERTFGFSVDTVIRTLPDLHKIRKSDPFANIDVTNEIRLYVTFLADKPASSLPIPYTSADKSFRILSVTKSEVYSVLDLAIAHTPDAMNILEKSYGKKITTRNWNTILKIIDSLVSYMQRLTLLLLLAACIAIGCDSDTTPADPEESLSLTISGFKPSRPNEIYALWIEFPAAKAATKHSPQHGESVYRLVSTFDVTTNGDLLGLDVSNLAEKLGVSLELAKHGLISIEKKDSIGPEPNIEFLVGEVVGTATTGNATLKHDHQEGVAYPLQTLSAEATLASPASAPDDYKGEVYLMRATDPAIPQASIVGLIPLPSKWRYALWAIDSTTRSLPPFNIFYGYFSQVAQADSNPDDNRFSFPGGRYPAATSEAVYPLISGNITLMVSLEPNFGYSRPTVPFGAIVLETKIPADQAAFTPFTLENTALKLPQATLILDR